MNLQMVILSVFVARVTILMLLCSYRVIKEEIMSDFDKRFEKLKCSLYIPAEIVEEVDAMAKVYGASRSVMVSFILKTYLDQQKVVDLAKALPKQD